MFLLKNSIFILLISFLFFGASGIIVHEHHCKKEGTTFSFFLPVEHECEHEVVPLSCHEKSCCAAPSQNKDLFSFEDEPCCVDATNYLHLDQDWQVCESNSYVFQLLNAEPNIQMELFQIDSGKGFFCCVRPPPVSLGQRLAFLQTYLI